MCKPAKKYSRTSYENLINWFLYCTLTFIKYRVFMIAGLMIQVLLASRCNHEIFINESSDVWTQIHNVIGLNNFIYITFINAH